MRIFYDEDYDIAISEAVYNMLPGEDEEEEFETMEIDIEVSQEITIEELNKYMVKKTADNPLDYFKIKEILDERSICYHITDSSYIDFKFRIVEKIDSNRKPELLKTKVKILNIEVK